MNEAAFFLDDVRTAFVEMADEAADVLFVAGNDAGRENDRVAFFDLHSFVSRRRQIPESGARSRPANPSRDNRSRRHRAHASSPSRDHRAVRDLQQSLLLGDLDILLHRAAEHADLSAEFVGDVEDDLQPMQRRRERRDEQAARRLLEDLFETRVSPPVPTACVPARSRLSNRTATQARLRRRIRPSVFRSYGLPITGVSSIL